MSKYASKLSVAIAEALAGIPSAQPAQVAGYWANRGFWLAEFRHLVSVCSEYEERVKLMARAFEDYVGKKGGPHNRDESGHAYQDIGVTTTRGQRKEHVGAARSALKRLADRALDLGIIDDGEFDEFNEQLRAIRFD